MRRVVVSSFWYACIMAAGGLYFFLFAQDRYIAGLLLFILLVLLSIYVRLDTLQR